MTLNLLNPENPILEQLEWNIIINEVVGNAHFQQNAAKEIFGAPLPKDSINTIFKQTAQLEELYFSDHFTTITNALNRLKDESLINETLSRLEKSAILEIKELNSLATLLSFSYEYNDTLNSIFTVSDDALSFLGKLQRIFLKDFRKLVNPDNSINYDGHPILKQLHDKKNQLEISIRNFINNLQSTELGEKLQYIGHDIINDHYVVPIRSDSYSSKIGEIISRSETGNTLYVEPFEIRDLSFKRLNIIVEIQNIIYKLTQRFSEVLYDFIHQIKEFKQQVYDFDTAVARVHYAVKFGLNCPQIADQPKIAMDNFYHPLLKDPVKNSLNLAPFNKGLVISGPNTGGKTVSLKSILLALLSLRHGLYVAASNSELYPFEGIFYFGNDQQNLTQGLSSFAAEVKNYNSLLENLEANNAIFIDEVFNSTSSEEASALALSYFNAIHKLSNSKILVSTHHQMLKSFIHQDDSYLSCHVGFDTEKHCPTYKLIFGIPGSSMALEIFQLLSKKDHVHQEIFKDSLKLLDTKVVNYNQLLEKISKKQGELDKLLTENRTLNTQLKNQKKAMDGVLQLKSENYIKDLERKIKKIEEEAEQLLKDIKKGDIHNTKQLYQSLKNVKGDISALGPEEKPKEPIQKKVLGNEPDNLIIGQNYYCAKINSKVTLKSFNSSKNEAIVAKGAFTLKCKKEDLRVNKQLEEIKRQFVFKYDKTSDAKVHYDCRGLRLEEFQDIVARSISDVLCGDVPYVSFIHGHGDGVLKKWIRKYIARHKDLKWDQGEHGNDGETKIVLK